MSILLIDPLIHKFSFVGALVRPLSALLTTAALVLLILGRKNGKLLSLPDNPELNFEN